MPIHIRELVVTATVEDPQLQATTSATTNGAPVADNPHSREELIQACVDEVLKALKKSNRR